ncbi:MAG: GIY-YIG nuclease family protein [Planctomycetes bacterium]|nr:GIY-YIG nuclease family protein [Planctomycetota bacterium]
MHWYVYVLVSDRLGRTYVGITTDVERRLAQHNGEHRGGARATRRGRPWRIGAVCGPLASRSQASKLEHEIKREQGDERIACALRTR